ncbi:hypothetical protein MRX96_035991 [Rhipicephalus microplus]
MKLLLLNGETSFPASCLSWEFLRSLLSIGFTLSVPPHLKGRRASSLRDFPFIVVDSGRASFAASIRSPLHKYSAVRARLSLAAWHNGRLATRLGHLLP